MTTIEYFLSDTAQTEQLGRRLAQVCQAPFVIYLSGDLGAGKTTFSRGFIQACGHRGAVKSPTYTLIEPYELTNGNVYHLDLYRLNDAAELDFLGLEDLLAGQGVCLIEWPERGGHYLPPADLTVRLNYANGGRQAVLTAHQARAESCLTTLSAHFSHMSHLKD